MHFLHFLVVVFVFLLLILCPDIGLNGGWVGRIGHTNQTIFDQKKKENTPHSFDSFLLEAEANNEM